MHPGDRERQQEPHLIRDKYFGFRGVVNEACWDSEFGGVGTCKSRAQGCWLFETIRLHLDRRNL